MNESEHQDQWKRYVVIAAFTLIGMGIGKIVGYTSAATLLGAGFGLLVFAFKK